MLSPVSLSAFTSGVAQATLGQSSQINRVRTVGAQQAQPASPTSQVAPTLPMRGGETTPSRNLPRGSLLDLSV